MKPPLPISAPSRGGDVSLHPLLPPCYTEKMSTIPTRPNIRSAANSDSFKAYCRFIMDNGHRGWGKAETYEKWRQERARMGRVSPSKRQGERYNTEGVFFGPGMQVQTAWSVVARIKAGEEGWTEELIGDTEQTIQQEMHDLLLQGIRELKWLWSQPSLRAQMEREPSLGLRFATKITELDKRVKQYAGQTSIKRAEDAAAVIASLLEKFPELAEPVNMLTETMVKGDDGEM